MKSFLGLALASFGLLNASGCSGPTEDATLEVSTTSSALTAPPSGASGEPAPPVTVDRHLEVTVTRVTAHVVASAEKADDAKNAKANADEAVDATEGGGWRTLFDGRKVVDLGNAAQVEALLATEAIPAGKVTQIRLVLADVALVEGATRTPVSCSSCGGTGLKIVTHGQVSVPAGGKLHLTLDFDSNASLKATSAGAYSLQPTIKVTKEEIK